MRALVTGGTGFIGSSIVRALLDAGYEVRALVRRGADRRNLEGLEVELVQGDITDIDSLRLAVHGCERVFHAAALYSFWVREPGAIHRVNVDGTRNVLEVAKEANVERVIYTSSVAALALPEGRVPVTEETPVDPGKIIGEYKKSKYRAEQVALEYARNGLPVVIVNPSFPVGPRDIKPTPTGRTILDFLNRRLPAYVETGMNVVDVEDVALGHLLAAEKGRIGERYILGGKDMTMGELLALLSEITEIPAPRVKLPYHPILGLAYLNAAWCRLSGATPRMTPETIRMSHHYMYYDPGKAIRELGLPQTPPKVALAKAVSWFRDNGYVKG
jgi:dihydroflavonol-4-reductase